MDYHADASRREFLRKSGLLAAVAVAGAVPAALVGAKGEPEAGEVAVSPAEDLMREHGLLYRLLLVYGEVIRRVEAREEVPSEPLTAAAWTIRSFIEEYHEKLEEEFLFPRFRKAGKLTDLVEVLAQQHQAGRRLTGLALELSTPGALRDAGNRKRLAGVLGAFVRMYGPHAAREDTVLFPELHRLWTPGDYAGLGEQFEKREEELFGENGFEKMVDRVAGIEKLFGLYELAQFTPR